VVGRVGQRNDELDGVQILYGEGEVLGAHWCPLLSIGFFNACAVKQYIQLV